MRRLVAYLTGGKPVVLFTDQNELYYTIAYKNPFVPERKCAHVYWFTKVGFVELLDAGNTTQPHYIKKWAKG